MKRDLSKSIIRKKPYPNNLLFAALGLKEVDFPKGITDDIRAGVDYAVSTLPDREQRVICGYYVEGKRTAELADQFAVTSNRIIQIENRAHRRLREPRCSDFMIHGVVGNLKRVAKESYNHGYKDGFKEATFKARQEAVERKKQVDATIRLLDLPLENLNLSVRSFNALHRIECKSLGDIVALDDKEIRRIKGIGKVCSIEIAKMIESHGIKTSWWSIFLKDKEKSE